MQQQWRQEMWRAWKAERSSRVIILRQKILDQKIVGNQWRRYLICPMAFCMLYLISWGPRICALRQQYVKSGESSTVTVLQIRQVMITILLFFLICLSFLSSSFLHLCFFFTWCRLLSDDQVRSSMAIRFIIILKVRGPEIELQWNVEDQSRSQSRILSCWNWDDKQGSITGFYHASPQGCRETNTVSPVRAQPINILSACISEIRKFLSDELFSIIWIFEGCRHSCLLTFVSKYLRQFCFPGETQSWRGLVWSGVSLTRSLTGKAIFVVICLLLSKCHASPHLTW